MFHVDATSLQAIRELLQDLDANEGNFVKWLNIEDLMVHTERTAAPSDRHLNSETMGHANDREPPLDPAIPARAQALLADLKKTADGLANVYFTLENLIRSLYDISMPSILHYGLLSLPPEILSRIAVLSRPSPRQPNPTFPLVCRRFREIELGTPELWKQVNGNMDPERIDLQVERAGGEVGAGMRFEVIDGGEDEYWRCSCCMGCRCDTWKAIVRHADKWASGRVILWGGSLGYTGGWYEGDPFNDADDVEEDSSIEDHEDMELVPPSDPIGPSTDEQDAEEDHDSATLTLPHLPPTQQTHTAHVCARVLTGITLPHLTSLTIDTHDPLGFAFLQSWRTPALKHLTYHVYFSEPGLVQTEQLLPIAEDVALESLTLKMATKNSWCDRCGDGSENLSIRECVDWLERALRSQCIRNVTSLNLVFDEHLESDQKPLTVPGHGVDSVPEHTSPPIFTPLFNVSHLSITLPQSAVAHSERQSYLDSTLPTSLLLSTLLPHLLTLTPHATSLTLTSPLKTALFKSFWDLLAAARTTCTDLSGVHVQLCGPTDDDDPTSALVTDVETCVTERRVPVAFATGADHTQPCASPTSRPTTSVAVSFPRYLPNCIHWSNCYLVNGLDVDTEDEIIYHDAKIFPLKSQKRVRPFLEHMSRLEEERQRAEGGAFGWMKWLRKINQE
jgi:hypothetical protein